MSQHRIPKVREVSFFPSLSAAPSGGSGVVGGDHDRLCNRHFDEEVDSLVKASGGCRDLESKPRVDTGISKSTVSRICADIDEEVEAFRWKPLDQTTYPYVWLDATYLKARKDHRIVSRAVVVATAVTSEGNREVLDLDIGDSEDEVFWTELLRRLKERGLNGVLLVISDAHSGLKAAISRR